MTPSSSSPFGVKEGWWGNKGASFLLKAARFGVCPGSRANRERLNRAKAQAPPSRRRRPREPLPLAPDTSPYFSILPLGQLPFPRHPPTWFRPPSQSPFPLLSSPQFGFLPPLRILPPLRPFLLPSLSLPFLAGKSECRALAGMENLGTLVTGKSLIGSEVVSGPRPHSPPLGWAGGDRSGPGPG